MTHDDDTTAAVDEAWAALPDIPRRERGDDPGIDPRVDHLDDSAWMRGEWLRGQSYGERLRREI